MRVDGITGVIKVDTKVSYSAPPIYGDDFSNETYSRLWREAQGRAKERYTVAPKCTVAGHGEGSPITLADLRGDQQLLNRLINEKVVIEISQAEVEARKGPSGDRSRYRLDPKRKGCVGKVWPGAYCCAADFGPPEPIVTNYPGDGNRAAHTHTTPSGQEILESLIAKGIVLDTKKRA